MAKNNNNKPYVGDENAPRRPSPLQSTSSPSERRAYYSSSISDPDPSPSTAHNPVNREATELSQIPPAALRDRSASSISSGSVRMVRTRSHQQTSISSREPTGPFRVLKKYWNRNVVLTVEQKQNRDHFGMFLSFFFVSLSCLCMILRVYWNIDLYKCEFDVSRLFNRAHCVRRLAGI